MVSREQKKAGLHEKLQLLRSITHSHAVNKTSIVIDASRYIQELKQKVVRLNQEIACMQNTTKSVTPLPTVTVESIGDGFLINVFSVKNMPGLLVSVLEAFEELGLNVLQARASCADSFYLETVGGENLVFDAHVVKQAVIQAIKSCSSQSDESD
ncbi:hypothetical protein LUZ60_013110 [Juncus effusus]|nr:hypothetical protein LUZ60_013110 [Juncus effusus]